MSDRLRAVSGITSAYELLLQQYRENRKTDRDPDGSRSCRKRKIKPLLRLLVDTPRGELHILGADTPEQRAETFQSIASACRVCGLCSKHGE